MFILVMPHSAIYCKRLVPNLEAFEGMLLKRLDECSCIWRSWGQLSYEVSSDELNATTQTDLAKCTSLPTCKRNFSQDHATTVTEQTEDLVFIHIHLFRPARGNSPRIMPPQLLNRQRISSSSTYISSDLQEEILPGSCHHSYWTDRGSHLHPYPRNGLLDNFLSFMNHDFE